MAKERTLENPIRGEIYSVERLEDYALYLAKELQLSGDSRVGHPLLPRMRENGARLLQYYRELTTAIHNKESLSPAADWLTDNFHIVENQLREIEEDLPTAFYKELPKIAQGELAGHPRIYALALALVAHTDSQLEIETIRRFVQSYQKITPLKIGELWALPITLRLVLIENLCRLVARVVEDHEKTNLANKKADELFEAAEEKARLDTLTQQLLYPCRPSIEDDCSYAAQIAKRLRDQEPELWPALEHLETLLASENSSTEKVVHLSHQRQAENQVTVANIITSMRLISGINWRIFFESLSLVDRILETDPVYAQMDFATRDRYRHVIEKIGKRTDVAETEIARKIIEFTQEPRGNSHSDPRLSHVGYYLIGAGSKKAEDHFACGITPRISGMIHAYSNAVYFGLFGFFLTLIYIWPISYLISFGASLSFILGTAFVVFFPCSELSLALTNLVLTHSLRPTIFPKMDLAHGLPVAARTFVVIPCMLSDTKTISDLLERLEIHYLGNNDNQLFFALLTDHTDAASAAQPDDEDRLEMVLTGIEALNNKYARNQEKKFHLFHRRRQWNENESVWMGWERKCGKIQEFNRLLRGDAGTSFSVVTAAPILLRTIRFVITLDADTQLPRDTARKLIGTIMHPLNLPRIDKTVGRVTEGYGILQPRIGISLESANRSFFAKLFSGAIGVDPYTTAVSDVYQDLFGEGSYTGKGIYDVDAFMVALENRIPENTVLSHDLFEGLFARVGLLTDIELLDDYPQTYRSFFTRQHRWTRGDWQIGTWLLPFVLDAKAKWTRNRLPLISKWKILDNLRRSLVAPFSFVWFVLAWTVLPGAAALWIAYAILLLILPSLTQTLISTGKNQFNKKSPHFFSNFLKLKTSFMQIFLSFIFLGHQTCIQLDAIARVLYRKFISGRKLLEWTPSAQIDKQIQVTLWQTYWPAELLLLSVLLLIVWSGPPPISAVFLILLWMSHPLVAALISRRTIKTKKIIKSEDELFLRQIGRRTWHYFETFVGPDDNWLPPDNHQLAPLPLTAHRTSPTNIGLYILALVSARDLGYLSTTEFIRRLQLTLQTLHKMKLYEGHYLNWYDTQTLKGLHPKYISTVDSGNLAGYFLAAAQVCAAIENSPALETAAVKGLRDTLLVIENELAKMALPSQFREGLRCVFEFTQSQKNTCVSLNLFFEQLYNSVEKSKSGILTLKNNFPAKDFSVVLGWTEAALAQIKDARGELLTLAPWADGRFSNVAASLSLDENTTLANLPERYEKAFEKIQALISASGPTPELEELQVLLHNARGKNSQLLAEAKAAAGFMNQRFEEMNFDFLLDKKRGIFLIGYNITDGKFDNGLYDLLGSESRLASFVAIAKGDVPQEHWFRLGRQLVPIAEGRALISWTASMFEYLMPVLVMRHYDNTLLEETTRSVVNQQIGYGKKHRVPWGVSEAGYNARDLQMNYQYGPFGIPGLGLKRGLSQDLVISPYSTVLAAMIQPAAAIRNLRRLMKENLLTVYGFYEAIDYTTKRLQENQNFAVIKSFMAHHQGMSLLAINNVLNDNILQDRFHSDARVQATRLLLQERIPQDVVVAFPKAAAIELEDPIAALTSRFVRHYTDPNCWTPHIQLLANQNYSVMLTNAGGGFSKCKGLAVTRWKEDVTRDNYGSFIFIRDHSQKKLWSTTFQPLCDLPQDYKASFGEEKAEFRRRDGDVSTYTQIIVAPEDDVEIRHVSLTNHSEMSKIIELTSYLEPVLMTGEGDLSHPAFSKLFIQTEYLSSKNALLAKRRKRSANEAEIWGLHSVATDAEILSEIQYETDRLKFIGRGRNIQNAFALAADQNLSNTTGATLDPILALRIKVRLPARSKIQIAFTTGLTSTHQKALTVIDRYHDIHSFEREASIAWTKSQADMRHLNINSEMAYLFQRLAEKILYSDTSLKPPAHQRAANTSVQSSLWPSGISGDLPIVLLRIRDQKAISFVRMLLRGHEYLRLKGLVYDFVIINEHRSTYLQELQDEIQHQIRSLGAQHLLNKPGGLFVLQRDNMAAKDLAHIHSVARVSLSTDEPLKDQITRKPSPAKYPAGLQIVPAENYAQQSAPLAPALDFFNGFGGFANGGKEYRILLEPGKPTPAPWINVIGNKLGFGFQISESGAGYTWSTNSQTNRLTPWSNDAVSDPPGEIIYLRDEDTGEIWTPTPLPIPGNYFYSITHGQGYSRFTHDSHGLQHNLTVFVPTAETIKISLLKIKNLTSRKRKISITSFTDLVLGTRREKTSSYLICEVDSSSSAIFARNPHDNEFAKRVTFADFSPEKRTFSFSRKEFLGRNGNYEIPAALSRTELSGKKETGQDPCAALQTKIELAPGEEFEMSILLGQCENIDSARELSRRYRNLETVKLALNEAINVWNDLTQTIQVKTPEPAMDILMNNWLLYQSLSCRYWARTAFYQSGGAYGFRDQLQDSMALVYSVPQLTREHILRSSERQFKEGDVQHWWHPPSGRGVRTRMSDDLLWLPYVVSFYVRITGDKSILGEKTPFLEAPLLKPEDEDSYTLPAVSAESATVFEHCLRAINRSLTLGKNGLPLIGTGDWNDGMNRVGAHGQGESVWLGWFLHKVITDFLPFCDGPELAAARETFTSHLQKLKTGLETNGWDGNWYRRAFYDDGAPLGSSANDECRIDSIAQTWAVLSKAGDPERMKRAMENLAANLIREESRLIMLLTPPFDKTANDPGYIKGYVPGVRENGGQYTHAAIWVIMAYAELGKGNEALKLFNMLNPVLHSENHDDAMIYKTEPYVVAADVYAHGEHEGRGGWTWYTGSSAWYYRAGLESLLGFKLQGNKLMITPCIPSTWKSYEISYRFGKSRYTIEVKNPKGLCNGIAIFELDGVLLRASEVELVDDGADHKVTATLDNYRELESSLL